MKFRVKPVNAAALDQASLRDLKWLKQPLMFDHVRLIPGSEVLSTNPKVVAGLTSSRRRVARPGFSLVDPLVQLVGIFLGAQNIRANLHLIGETVIQFGQTKIQEGKASYEVEITRVPVKLNSSPPTWRLHATGWARWGDIFVHAKDIIVLAEIEEE